MNFLKELYTTSALRKIFIFMLLTYILIFVAAFMVASQYFVISENMELETAKNQLEDTFDNYTDILKSVNSYVLGSDEVTNEQFLTFIEQLDTDDYFFEAIYIAPGGKVSNVYPNSELIRYNNLDIIDNHNGTIVGEQFTQMEPNKLITTYNKDNSVDFLLPVFKNDSFYALVGISLHENDISNIFNSYEVELYEINVLFNETYVIGDSPTTSHITRGEKVQLLDSNFYIQMSKKDGVMRNQLLYMLLFVSVVTGLGVLAMFFIMKDYRKKEQMIAKLNYQNDYDLVTDIFNNRRLFSDLEKLTNNNREFYLAFGVFNNVKFIYNKFGKKIGEAITIKSISRIKKILLNKSTIYHYGGDEYVIVFRNSNKGEIINVLHKIAKQFEEDIILEKARVKVSISFGITSFPGDGASGEELINNAHITLSKSRGFMRSNFEFFKLATVSAEMFNQDFDDYINNIPIENFEVYLMPVVATSNNEILGFECLSRVKDDLGNNINIGDVISSFERNGRITELDEHVFKKLLSIKKLLNMKYNKDIFLSSNCSALSLNEEYVDNVIKLYRAANLKFGTIVIELTESYKVEDHDYLVELFRKLNKAGIQVAIDDFGTGYSSLSYITKFPIYAIKIDKQYVRDYKDNEFNRTLMSTLVSIANSIKCKLVAEGVDEHETLEFLRKSGCKSYQGFLFSKGVPLVEAIQLLDIEKEKQSK